MGNITESQGYMNDVAFQLSGPEHLVEAIKNYIRNLTKMHGGKNNKTHIEKVTTTTIHGN